MIGGGGMANVYLAHDDILGRDVAVKILRLDYSNNEEFIKRFHREAQSVTTLSHPNIVNMYDVGEEDGIYYLVMEYVPGRTLKQYIIDRGMLPIGEALDIMEQLTSAMAHAHHFEIVHRDIKPHNILIRDDGSDKSNRLWNCDSYKCSNDYTYKFGARFGALFITRTSARRYSE